MENNQKVNIVYFVADQMRSDSLHHLGCEASITPNLDNILNEGVSFRNAYCQNPVCTPSRCSFMTGLYPHTTGHRTMHFMQSEGEPNILRTMKNNGYEVCWVGRNDLIPADIKKSEYCDHYFCGQGRDLKDDVSTNHATPFKPVEVEEVKPHIEPGYYSHFVGKISNDEAYEGSKFAASDWKCLEEAINFINEKSKDKTNKPFFLYCTLTFPHPPYKCEDPYFSSIDRNKCEKRRPDARTLKKCSMMQAIAEKQNLENWGDENFIEMRAVYLAMVSRFDHQFGMLCDSLKKNNFYDNTSIFVFSDHGDYTGDYNIAEKIQNTFENPAVNVPLLIKPAKKFKCNPRISNELCELVDLTSTIEDMTGVKTEYVHFGKSLVPLLEKEVEIKDAAFSEGGRIHGELWAMENGHNADSVYWPRISTQALEGPAHGKGVMIRMSDMKYIYRLYESDELYDLKNDPKELNNLVDDPEYKDIILKMKCRMLDWFVETGDTVPNRKDPRF